MTRGATVPRVASKEPSSLPGHRESESADQAEFWDVYKGLLCRQSLAGIPSK